MKHALTRSLFSFLFVATLLSVLPMSVGAQSAESGCGSIPFIPQISIPGTPFVGGVEGKVDCRSLGTYISSLYTFSVYAGAMVAAVILMVGGFLWLTSGGNVNQVGTAKAYIGGALSGFILLLVSWVLLNTINPNLVRFKPLNIAPIVRVSGSCCVCTTLAAGADSSGGQINYNKHRCSPLSGTDAELAQACAAMATGAETCVHQKSNCSALAQCAGTSGYCGARSLAPASVQSLTSASTIVCSADTGYVCNAAFDCTAGASTPRERGSAVSSAAANRSGCCLPKQTAGSPCHKDSDCLNDSCYKDTWIDPDVVGVCQAE